MKRKKRPPAHSQAHALVTMFGEQRICVVTAVGEPQSAYSREKTLWVERAEDEYAIQHYKPPFCILDQRDWLRGLPQ